MSVTPTNPMNPTDGAGPDPQAWAALKADLLTDARAWQDTGLGEKSPAFLLADDWITRALALPGIDPKSLDYLAKIARASGRLTIHNGLFFTSLEDGVHEARRQAKSLQSTIDRSPMMQLLAQRVSSK